MGHPNQVTLLLEQLSGGNHTVIASLMPLVYDELHAMAHRQLRKERSGHTINTTALVHEAYLKLVHQREVNWQNRAHFLSVAALAMRRILIDYAHQHKAQKRGGGQVLATFDEALMGEGTRADELIAIDEALRRLAQLDERQSKVVEYRFFGGLTQEEIGEVLGVSVHTVRRDWRMARAWLSREITNELQT